MANGKIKWFNMKKGYGFIEPENGEKDVFIHISALEKAGIKFLNENQKVSYEVNQTKGKLSLYVLTYFSFLVRLLGFEPRTAWSVAKRSIQLSYRRIIYINYLI